MTDRNRKVFNYSVLRLVSRHPGLFQIVGVLAVLAIGLQLAFPTGAASLAYLALPAIVLIALFLLCFVEIVCLMANTLLPR